MALLFGVRCFPGSQFHCPRPIEDGSRNAPGPTCPIKSAFQPGVLAANALRAISTAVSHPMACYEKSSRMIFPSRTNVIGRPVLLSNSIMGSIPRL